MPLSYKSCEQTSNLPHFLPGSAWWQLDTSGLAQVIMHFPDTFCRQSLIIVCQKGSSEQHLYTATAQKAVNKF